MKKDQNLPIKNIPTTFMDVAQMEEVSSIDYTKDIVDQLVRIINTGTIHHDPSRIEIIILIDIEIDHF